MNYIFGPVRSRRLGFSLGVDVIPYKTCSLDCPYCQLGRTTVKTIDRSPYGDADAVIVELIQVLQEQQKIDYITLSGSGEPTLSSNLGTIIRRIKEITVIPVAVLTNGTLLHREEVREELSAADLVVPSIDAVSEDIFRMVNRPHPLVTVQQMLVGLEQFRLMFGGQLWLEIMLLKGINDREEEIEKIKKAIAAIAVDRVQLNTPIRPAWDSSITPLSARELDRIKKQIGVKCEVIAGTEIKQRGIEADVEERIVSVIQRRPLNLPEIADSLGMPPAMVSKHLAHLEEQGRVTTRHYGSELFYQMTR
jgi:wyosine [tRNA(Phe)-imidazoG37] synthetase (radical SAM superfamily)